MSLSRVMKVKKGLKSAYGILHDELKKGQEAKVEGRSSTTLFAKSKSTDDSTSMTCPITLMVMRNPVLAQDGHNYEQAALQNWVQIRGLKAVSPMDNKTEVALYLLNRELRNRIHDEVLKSPELAEEFCKVHKDAILNPVHELDEVDFSAKLKKAYPDLVRSLLVDSVRQSFAK